MQDKPSVSKGNRFSSLEPESQLCSALVMSTKMATQATFSHLVSKRSIKNYKKRYSGIVQSAPIALHEHITAC